MPTPLRTTLFARPTRNLVSFVRLAWLIRRYLALLVIISSVAICAGCRTSQSKLESRPDWLPARAQIVFTSQWADGFLPDATFKLKAKVSEAEFASAVRQLGLTPHTKHRKYTDDISWLHWTGDADKRWDPSQDVDATFVRQEGDWWELAKYENGFLYYQSLNH